MIEYPDAGVVSPGRPGPSAGDRKRAPRRQRQKAATRRRILDAAGDAFEANGFVGTSIEAIVEAADVSRPTFYQYFKNKTDALSAVVLEQRSFIIGHIDELGAGLQAKDLRHWLDGLLERFETHHATTRAWVQAESIEPEFRSVVDVIMNSVVDSIAEHFLSATAHRDSDSQSEVRSRVMLLILQLERYTYFASTRGWGQDREAVLSALTDMWQAALLRPSGP